MLFIQADNAVCVSGQACWSCFYQVMKTLDRMLTLAIEDSSEDPAYRAALLGARLFMTVTWVRALSSPPDAAFLHALLSELFAFTSIRAFLIALFSSSFSRLAVRFLSFSSVFSLRGSIFDI